MTKLKIKTTPTTTPPRNSLRKYLIFNSRGRAVTTGRYRNNQWFFSNNFGNIDRLVRIYSYTPLNVLQAIKGDK